MPLYCRERDLLKDVGLWWYAEQYPNTLYFLARRVYDSIWLAGARPTREECESELARVIREHRPMRDHLLRPKYTLAHQSTLNAYTLKLAQCVLHSFWTLIERPE